jgi:hypothetical protein
MKLILTQGIKVRDGAAPQSADGFHPTVYLSPGAYDLVEVPNPTPKPPHIPEEHWCTTWLVVRGTMHGISRYAMEHKYLHHRDPSVALIL